jgi:hypothetical protein
MIPNLKSLQVTLTDANNLAFLTWVAFAVGVFGILLSWYFYLKSARSKRPYCLTFTHSISKSVLVNDTDLRITYKGSTVPRLAVTKLVFWNAGTETISGADVPTNSPFAISVGGPCRFLNFTLDSVKKLGNGVALSIDEDMKNVIVKFDYFDKNDGFVVELLHTGESNSAIKVEATFKGAHALVHRSAAPFLSLPRPVRKLLVSEHRALAGFMLTLAPLIILLDSHFRFMPSWWGPTIQLNTVVDYIANFVAFGSIFLAGIYLLRTRLPAGFTLNWQ